MRTMSVAEFVRLMKDELDNFEQAYAANVADGLPNFPQEMAFKEFLYGELPIFMDSPAGEYD